MGPKYVGPFTIKKRMGLNAYELSLPCTWKIHPVFNVNKLRGYIEDEEFLREEQLISPELMEDHLEYQVQTILDHRMNKRTKQREFLIR